MQDIWPRLETIFQDVFDDSKLKISPQTTAENVPGWDSLSNINLVMAVESEFKIKFALGEIQELKNVGDMVSLIEKKSAKK
jgi:acyl carrier protein